MRVREKTNRPGRQRYRITSQEMSYWSSTDLKPYRVFSPFLCYLTTHAWKRDCEWEQLLRQKLIGAHVVASMWLTARMNVIASFLLHQCFSCLRSSYQTVGYESGVIRLGCQRSRKKEKRVVINLVRKAVGLIKEEGELTHKSPGYFLFATQPFFSKRDFLHARRQLIWLAREERGKTMHIATSNIYLCVPSVLCITSTTQ